MFDYPLQPGAAKPPRQTRVNWTQTVTITLAACVGCLLALGACWMLYRHLLGSAIRAKSAELDALQNRIDDTTYKVVRQPTKRPDPAPKPDPVEATVDPVDETEPDTDTTYVPPVIPGTPIETTKAV
ncbi:hypothetical protein GCM10027578_22140 [Spirosoma luteolum]